MFLKWNYIFILIKIKIEEMDKCFVCKKNVIVKFICKCDNTFCIKHRMPEDHECTFNFKEHSKKILEKQNPIIIGKKVDSI